MYIVKWKAYCRIYSVDIQERIFTDEPIDEHTDSSRCQVYVCAAVIMSHTSTHPPNRTR